MVEKTQGTRNKKGKPFEDFPFCFYESLVGLFIPFH